MSAENTATAPSTDTDWDEGFERDLARFLRDRLADNPPPAESAFGRDAALWAANLKLRAEARRVGIAP